jgi:arsenate reductase
MAEAFLNVLGNGKFEAESAGLEPGVLNSTVVEVMKEIGIDISQNQTNSVFDFYKAGKRYNYVFTVCDEASGEKCPIFPGTLKTIHMGFTDPSSLTGENKLEQTRKIRDEIKTKIQEFIGGF